MGKDGVELNLKRGKRLKYERQRKQMTQEQLAEYANYSVQHISYIENGKRKMGYEAAHVFSEILGVPVNYLMCETDYKSSPCDSPFDSKRLEFLFSNIFSIMFEYGYDLVGILMVGFGIDNAITYRSVDYKIELLSKICVNKKISSEFVFELCNYQKEVNNFSLVFKTPYKDTINLTAEELSECVGNIIQYSQLQFLNLIHKRGEIFEKLVPIFKSDQQDYFYFKDKELSKHDDIDKA